MKLTPEQILANWNTFLGIIETHISSPRKEKLLAFYEKYAERISMMPAAHKKEYHNAFPGGYVEHVIRVVNAALEINKVWVNFEVDSSTYTIEELVFSALNHDLGKMGNEEHEAYIPQTDQWRRDKLGEEYMYNTAIPFASVPDKGLFLLQSHGIDYTFNEMLTIRLHDGLYDDANKPYLMSWSPETKPRTSLIYIVHQADLLAARIEFEREWNPILNGSKPSPKESMATTKKIPVQGRALQTVKSNSLKGLIDSL
jgi:hypothetical protein